MGSTLAGSSPEAASDSQWTLAKSPGVDPVQWTPEITNSTHNYDVGSLYIEPDGTWRVIDPTEPGPQLWGTGGEMAMWVSRDEGATWAKAREMTRASERNHTYSRRPIHAHPDFYAYWADGDPDRQSISRLYFSDREGNVRVLPHEMDGEFARPERVRLPARTP